MSPVRCPVCERLFQPDESPAMPFCSDRCRLIDLQHWLDEEYGLAIESDQQPEGPDAQDAAE